MSVISRRQKIHVLLAILALPASVSLYAQPQNPTDPTIIVNGAQGSTSAG